MRTVSVDLISEETGKIIDTIEVEVPDSMSDKQLEDFLQNELPAELRRILDEET